MAESSNKKRDRNSAPSPKRKDVTGDSQRWASKGSAASRRDEESAASVGGIAGAGGFAEAAAPDLGNGEPGSSLPFAPPGDQRAIAAMENEGGTTGRAPGTRGERAAGSQDQSSGGSLPPSQIEGKVHGEVLRCLAEAPDLFGAVQDLAIIVTGGVVTIRGKVASQRLMDEIGRSARAVPGVDRVQNELRVTRL